MTELEEFWKEKVGKMKKNSV